MATIEIPDDLVKTLNKIAEREGRTVEEIAKSALGQFSDAHWIPVAAPEDSETASETNDLFTLVIRAAHELGEGSRQGNVSERSRELLSTDFADYLMRRHRGQL